MGGQSLTIRSSDGGEFQAYLALPPQGKGPGLVILQEIFGVNRHVRAVADRYASEGYVVLAPDLFWRMKPGLEFGYSQADIEAALPYYEKFDQRLGLSDIADTVAGLRSLLACSGRVGVLGYCLGGTMAFRAAAACDVDVAICYYGGGIVNFLEEAESIKCPILMHFGALDEDIPLQSVERIRDALLPIWDVEVYVYPDAGHGFNCDERASYDRQSAMIAYGRTLDLMHRAIGPRLDLSGLWDAHCRYEFDQHDVEATMGTMVAEPYVNHVPTMTGGVGREALSKFYAEHFLPKLPPDTRIKLLSRTVGANRVVDELLFCCTHDRQIDFLLPGVAPTGKYVEVPTVAVVTFRGDKIENEHIYWDQASLLVQIGLLKQDGLPVAGIETAKKLADPSLPSNTLLKGS
jgi:carboxymethylenebutenolidase